MCLYFYSLSHTCRYRPVLNESVYDSSKFFWAPIIIEQIGKAKKSHHSHFILPTNTESNMEYYVYIPAHVIYIYIFYRLWRRNSKMSIVWISSDLFYENIVCHLHVYGAPPNHGKRSFKDQFVLWFTYDQTWVMFYIAFMKFRSYGRYKE